jgi:RNA polymerase sigma-70 factor (family 1)
MTAYRNYSDQELTVLLKKGDQDAYTEIYNRYNNLLYRHAYKKTGDASAAQDVLQDVFLSLWNRKAEVDEAANLAGYLYTAIRNKILNLFAQKKVRDRYEDSVLQFTQIGVSLTDHLIREKQLAELIEKEIAAMPEKMRAVFMLSRKQHLKNKEIAGLLHISEHTVATQLKRALKHLRTKLGLVLYVSIALQSKFPVNENKLKKDLPDLYPNRIA